MTRANNDQAFLHVEREIGAGTRLSGGRGLGARGYTMKHDQDWSVVPEVDQKHGLAPAAQAFATGQEDTKALSLAGYR